MTGAPLRRVLAALSLLLALSWVGSPARAAGSLLGLTGAGGKIRVVSGASAPTFSAANKTATAPATATNSFTVTKPACATGATLVAFYLGMSTSSPTALGSTQSTFNKAISRIDTNGLGDFYQAAAYTRTVDGSETSTYTFTQTATGAEGGYLSMLCVTGANASPVDDSAGSANTAATTTPTAASVTPTTSTDLQLIWAWSYSTGSQTTGWPTVASTGFTAITGAADNNSNGDNWYFGAEYKTLSASGATGTTVIPFPGTSQYNFQSLTLALKP